MGFVIVLIVGVLGIAYNLNLFLKDKKNFNAILRIIALIGLLSLYTYNDYFA